MNETFQTSFEATVERLLAEKDDITGVVITSAKKTFFAGGDLKDMTAEHTETKQEIAARITATTNGMKAVLRRLENFGKPVVSAINGAALGGGLEIALHTHHRIAADVRRSDEILKEKREAIDNVLHVTQSSMPPVRRSPVLFGPIGWE